MAVDHEAREKAGLAKQQIDAHEVRCGERWEQAHKTMDDLRCDIRDLRKDSKEDNKAIHSRINSLVRVAFSLIISLAAFAAVQWLLAKGVAQ